MSFNEQKEFHMKSMSKVLIPVAGLGLAMGIGQGVAGASAPSFNVDDYSFVTQTIFANDPSENVMTWDQATITLPTEPTWSAPGQEASGWLMGHLDDLANWNQVGWVSYGPGQAPEIYEETSVNGNDVAQYFGDLQWGQTLYVALSCDMGTGIWQDWASTTPNDLSLVSTQWTMTPCNSAVWTASMERFDAGASTFPSVGPESITNQFADLSGDEYFPSSVVSPGT